MDKNIAKSPEMLQKEAKVESLKKQLKKRKTVLKSLKTRLRNTKTSIEDVQRDVQSRLFSKMMEMDNLRVEIAGLAREFQQVDGISDEEKQSLGEMANELMEEDLFGEGFSEYKEQREKLENGEFEFEEQFRAKMNDVYEEFRVKPKEEEQRSIRSIFLKLSKKFHPDLAQTPKEEETFHKLMQQINEAYKNNDIQTLLEIEQMYLVEELDLTGKAITIDVLDEEIKRLERDLEFIEGQINRTSAEVKNLRGSDMGQMLTTMTKAKKEGEGVDTMVAEMEQAIEMLTKLRDGFKDSIKRNAISPILLELINPFAGTPLEGLNLSPDMSPEDMMNEMMSGMMRGDVDPNEMLQELMKDGSSPFGMFGDMFDVFDDDGEEIVDDPTFPIDSSVRVTKNISHPFRRKLKMKGWQGRVLGAFYNENDEEVYEILWDSETLKQIPKELILEMTMNDDEFHFDEIHFKHLEAAFPRDTAKEAVTTHRTLLHKNKWKYLDAADALRMEKILLTFPAASDEENWYHYLSKSLKFPFEAETQGVLDGETKRVKVLSVSDIDEEYGVVMHIQLGRRTGDYPLIDLQAVSKRSKNYKIIADYEEWAEDTL